MSQIPQPASTTVTESMKTQIKTHVGHFIGSALYALGAGFLTGTIFQKFRIELARRYGQTPVVSDPHPTTPAGTPVTAPGPVHTQPAAVVGLLGKLGAALEMLRQRSRNHGQIMATFVVQFMEREPHSFDDFLHRAGDREINALVNSLQAVARQNNYDDRRRWLKIEQLTDKASEHDYLIVKAHHVEQQAIKKTERLARRGMIIAITTLQERRLARQNRPQPRLTLFQQIARRTGS